jgi:hypothetical protein
LIFVYLYRLLPGAREALAIIKPEAVVKSHRAGFRFLLAMEMEGARWQQANSSVGDAQVYRRDEHC